MNANQIKHEKFAETFQPKKDHSDSSSIKNDAQVVHAHKVTFS